MTGDPTVLYGVRREFSYDEGGGAGHVRRRWVAPVFQPPDGVTPGELRAPRGRGELRGERPAFGFTAVESRVPLSASLRLVSRRGGFCEHRASVPSTQVVTFRTQESTDRHTLDRGRGLTFQAVRNGSDALANGIDPSASMAALFGTRVRRLRTAAGLTQAELGELTHVVSTRITQIERASGAKPTLELVRALDAALGAEELLVELWPYVYREAFPDWSRRFVEYSERAVVIRQYAAHVVPGLLQTEDYARAVLALDAMLDSEEQLEERITARMKRQERLSSPTRPELMVILDEAVLRRPIGGHGVMRQQLARLLHAAAERHIEVQVLPFDQGGHEAMGGSLTILTLTDSPEVAYTEGSDYGQLIEEPANVSRYKVIYDRLRAAALPPLMSLDMIRSTLEGSYRGANLPSKPERRRLAQEQLQQSGGRRLRGGGRRIPGGRRPRP